MPAAIGAMAGGQIIGGVFNYLANKDQIHAAQKASALAANAIVDQKNRNDTLAERANDELQAGQYQAGRVITGQNKQAQQTTQQTGASAGDALANAANQAQQTLGGQATAGRADITGGGNQQQAGFEGARGSVAGGAQSAAQTLMALANGRAGAMLNQPGGLYANLQMDPGIEYQREQGNQAIDRYAAAHGGRTSGATLKAIADYNQKLSQTGYADAASRRLQEFGAAANNDAYNAGIGTNLANLAMGAANTDANLQVGQGGAAANIGQLLAQYGAGLALPQAQLAQNAGTGQAGIIQNTGSQLAGYQNNLGTTIGQLDANTAGGVAGNLMNLATLNSSLTGSLTGAYQAPVQYAGQGLASIGNSFSNMGNNLAFLGALNSGGYGGYGGNPAGAAANGATGPGLSVPMNWTGYR